MNPKKFKSSWIWKLLGGVITLLLLAYVGLRMYADHIMLVNPDMKNTIEKWKATHVELPAEWHQPAVLPPDNLVAFHKKLDSELDRISAKHHILLHGSFGQQGLMDQLDTDKRYYDPQLFAAFSADLEPLIEEASYLSDQPGFLNYHNVLVERALDLNYNMFFIYTLFVADDAAKNGNYEKAFKLATLPIYFAQRPKQVDRSTHLKAWHLMRIASQNTAVLTGGTTDAMALRNTLQEWLRLRDAVLIDVNYMEYAEVLAPLRDAAAYGYPVDLSPKSQFAFTQQFIDTFETKKLSTWMEKEFPPGSLEFESARKHTNILKERATYNAHFLKNPKYFMYHPVIFKLATGYDLQLQRFANSQYDYAPYQQISAAWFNLVLMHIAHRLTELSDDPSPLTDYLSPLPDDPFSGAPFAYSTSHGYYSVGPDKKDDGAAIKYDAGNGMVSPGDIWLER